MAFFITSCEYDSVSEPEQRLTPDFTMKTLDGELFTLSDQQGKVVMLQFFASWWGGCQAGVPALNELHRQYSDNDFVLAAIAIQSGDSAQVKNEFANPLGVHYPILIDNGEYTSRFVFEAYKIGKIPGTVLIDKEGWIAAQYQDHLTKEQYQAAIDSLLHWEIIHVNSKVAEQRNNFKSKATNFLMDLWYIYV